MATMIIKGKTMRSVDVDWNGLYTDCPLYPPAMLTRRSVGKRRILQKNQHRLQISTFNP